MIMQLGTVVPSLQFKDECLRNVYIIGMQYCEQAEKEAEETNHKAWEDYKQKLAAYEAEFTRFKKIEEKEGVAIVPPSDLTVPQKPHNKEPWITEEVLLQFIENVYQEYGRDISRVQVTHGKIFPEVKLPERMNQMQVTALKSIWGFSLITPRANYGNIQNMITGYFAEKLCYEYCTDCDSLCPNQCPQGYNSLLGNAVRV